MRFTDRHPSYPPEQISDFQVLITDRMLKQGAGFINVYEMNRAYGGPEEGGWWYDTGKSLHSLPWSKSEWEAGGPHPADTLRYWLRWCNEQNDGAYSEGSVNCSGVYRVRLQDHAGKDFPEEHPRYE